MTREETCKWGILGTGNIAHRFAHDLKRAPGAEIAAVGSRSADTAERFGEEYDVPRRYASYEELAADDSIDVAYIATPHPMHKENTLLCLKNGKAVLCEKPMAMTAADVEQMICAAREKPLFLMEGLWTRFFPAVVQALDMIKAGRIGDVRLVEADFGFCSPRDLSSRVFDPALGGGALLDVGIYPVALAQFIFGREPDCLTAIADIGETGVDEAVGMTLGFGADRLAALSCSIRTNTRTEAHILGTEGYIRIPRKFFKPDALIVGRLDEEEEVIRMNLDGYGFTYEIREVMQSLRVGQTESALLPLDTTLAIMRTLDRIRAAWMTSEPGR